MNNDEIVQEILDTIVYGKEPGLQSTSCVDTFARGIDKDPNYHNGHYTLEGTTYTVTWCCDSIKIREGEDNGWYPGSGQIGLTLHDGTLDWKRLRQAFVMQEVYSQMGGKEAADSKPNLRDTFKFDLLSNLDFMLHSEIEEALATRRDKLKRGDKVTTGSLCAANVFVQVIGNTTVLRMGKEFRVLSQKTLEELVDILNNANEVAKDCCEGVPGYVNTEAYQLLTGENL